MTQVDPSVAREAEQMNALRAKITADSSERDIKISDLDYDCVSSVPSDAGSLDVQAPPPALALDSTNNEPPTVIDALPAPAETLECSTSDAPVVAGDIHVAAACEIPDEENAASEAAADGALPLAATVGKHDDIAGTMPDGYALFDDGIYVMPDDSMAAPLRVCSPVRVDAMFADSQRRGWGKVISVRAPDGFWHEVSCTNEELARWPAEVIGKLVDHGLELESDKKSRDRLLALLKAWKPAESLLSVDRMGWVDETRTSFVIGDSVIGDAKVVPHGLSAGVSRGLVVEGDLDGWRENVSLKCLGNPLMVTAVSLAFSGPLLAPLALDGGGLHFRGASSSGKTTLLRLAASVWGSQQLVSQWRATSNGLEAIASTLNDLMLPLDELAEISGRDLDGAIYMLANGTGKARMTKDATLAFQDRWRLALISSGEISVEEKLREASRNVQAGHEMRLVDIEADSRPFGAFDDLHGAASASSFAESINTAICAYHGSAGRSFVQHLINWKMSSEPKKIEAVLHGCVRAWLSKLPGAPDGQVSRVAKRLALVGIAGHLATNYGITGWDQHLAIESASTLFRDWYDRRYGERHDAADMHVKALQVFLAANSNALRPVGVAGDDEPVGWSDPTRAYLTSSTWSRIFPGVSGTTAAKALIDTQILLPEGNRSVRKAPRSIPGRPRLYTVNTVRLDSYRAS